MCNLFQTATFMDPLSFDEAVIVVLHAYDCTTMKGRLLRNYDLIWNQVELRYEKALLKNEAMSPMRI
ncbi:hypothetical protein Plhal304r1_c064g0151551 [Plasmopara halstedii]